MGGVFENDRWPGWALDEVPSAGRENLDPQHVDRYNGKEDADVAAEMALLCGLGLTQDWVVIDMGAGTEQFSLAVASWCGAWSRSDVSSVMLDRLRAKIGAAGVSNVGVVQAGFLSYRHEGEPADVVH
jgi:ubiquinone/menaquinone biosynthesis C-methylase UbiE